MNQEKLIQTTPPSIESLFYAIPTIKKEINTIEKSAIENFLLASRVFLGLDNNS